MFSVLAAISTGVCTYLRFISSFYVVFILAASSKPVLLNRPFDRLTNP